MVTLEILKYLATKVKTLIDGKVVKRAGFDLSQNDYTTADRTKVRAFDYLTDAEGKAVVDNIFA